MLLIIMKANVLDLQGKQIGQVELPTQFSEPVRDDLINRAFHAHASLFFQPKGSDPRAGLRTTAEYYGRRHGWRQTINTGRSRLPREKLSGGRLGRVLRVPLAVKGRRAHPPKPEKRIIEKINLKERSKAIRSCLAASIEPDLVSKKHIFTGALPLIVSDEFESLKKSKDVLNALANLGVASDLERVAKRTKRTSGVKRLRGRGKKVPHSVLIVVANDKGIVRAGRNLPGVKVALVDQLNASLVAPGGVPGRLILWTKSAVEKMGSEKLYYK